MQDAGGTVKMIDTEEKAAAAKATIGIGGAVTYHMTLNEWVAIITILYLILQIGLLTPKYWQMFKDWKAARG